jgi:hypothetical protein
MVVSDDSEDEFSYLSSSNFPKAFLAEDGPADEIVLRRTYLIILHTLTYSGTHYFSFRISNTFL